MKLIFPSCLIALLVAGCADVQTAGTKMHTWMRDYAFGRYHATPQQVQVAQQRATKHDAHVSPEKKKQRKESGQRYVAVRTLDPTPQQLNEIKAKAKTSYGSGAAGYGGPRRGLRPPPANPSVASAGEWHCVMIWDTWAKEVVGNDCYAVTALPAVGETARFDTFSAEYIGTGG